MSILELSATEVLHRCLTSRGCSCRKPARAGSPSSSLHSGSSASRIPNHQACLSLRARATPALTCPQPALTHRDGVRTRCSNVRSGRGSGRYPHYRVIATFTLTGTPPPPPSYLASCISHLASCILHLASCISLLAARCDVGRRHRHRHIRPHLMRPG